MYPTLFLSCLVFLLYLLFLPANPLPMFTDPDTYWHIASGDLIRELGALPEHDPWSFTAGNERWYNIAWGWDVIMSAMYQCAGWHGVIALNSIFIAATLAVIFATCLIRANDGISAFLATLLAAATLFNLSVRPHQVSLLLCGIFLLLLSQISRQRLSHRWLCIIPPCMVIWVNLHGGFLIGFFLLGIFGLECMAEKNWRLFSWLFATGVASLLACLINPYGIGIITGLLRTLNSNASTIIREWQPLSFSTANNAILIYLFLFLALVMMRPLPLGKAEKWAAYTWLGLGLFSVRHLPVFAVISAPLMALALHRSCTHTQASPHPMSPCLAKICNIASRTVHNGFATITVMLLAVASSLLITTPVATHLYQNESLNPLPDLSEEISYIETHHPGSRLLTSFNLGGPLIFLARGKVPLFIDGREATAYPQSLIHDYIAFHHASPHWDVIFDRYHLEGALILSSDSALMDRFSTRSGWHQAFRGKTATLFLMDNHP